MFGIYLQFFLAALTYPVVLAFDECMVMDSFAVVFRAEITFHELILLLGFFVALSKAQEPGEASMQMAMRFRVRPPARRLLAFDAF